MSAAAGPPATPSPGLGRLVRLALPTLVILAAEPLYVLVDSAVVGHLGRDALAALALGGSVLTVAAWFGTILAYGTTSRSARRFGAGDRAGAVAEGVQATWLALGLGVALAVGAIWAAGPLAAALGGGDPAVVEGAADWLRIAAWGAPGILLTMAGNGWLRGVQDTRRPLRYALGANALSAAACPLLVYPAGLGLVGSAWANVGAQSLGGLLFLRALLAERVPLRPRPGLLAGQLRLGRDLLVRGAAMQGSFLCATAVVARFGSAPLAAHQIAIQLWMFCAFVLDAVAIAAQALVGEAVGAGRPGDARGLARRSALLGLGTGTAAAVVLAAVATVLPRVFTPDPAVWAAAREAWPWFVGMQPLAGVVFALDGVLIGAGDAGYLRTVTVVSGVGVFVPASLAAAYADLGLGGVWAGLTLFVVARLALLLLRVRRPDWPPPPEPPDRPARRRGGSGRLSR
ncbi:MATE family efflux transporter [Pilimelia terevasa]|uniref:MATE family efflux transporter n=1 Tax=Pilimelia terevasa TaxID=53372 RepID=A0A8J3FH73_9ACTN|nr:MATE family efflux transporter [Pilimelia terevasa]GGK27760.1 MATE family efflux transporter [Pilimelia terevasa]